MLLFKNGGEIIEYEGINEIEAYEDFLIHELNDLEEVYSIHCIN